ncbi:MAG: FGGY family carbohydrate kinase [Patescibacteria group bacterium]|nr:FGGY family carbohydrate kinase [Patescibacteria group bacterium]
MTHYLLGIDNGGTVAKAGLFDLEGRELATAGRKTPMNSPAPGHTERDMDALWEATAEAVREVIQRAAVDPARIACVATAGHGNGYVYVTDATMKPGTYPLVTGVCRFPLEEVKKRTIRVTEPPENDPHCVGTFLTHNPDVPFGADGLTMDNDGSLGRLDRPSEALVRGNELMICNFDMPIPGGVNRTFDAPHTISVIQLPESLRNRAE